MYHRTYLVIFAERPSSLRSHNRFSYPMIYRWIKFNTHITTWLHAAWRGTYTRHFNLAVRQSSEWLPTFLLYFYYLFLKPNFHLSKEQSSTPETTEIREKLETVGETQNIERVTYVSGNVFEGLASESIPHNKGRLCLDGGAIYEVTIKLCSRPNVNISLHNIGILRTI